MTPKQECERLMNELVPFAKRMLGEQGEFWPFDGAIEAAGRAGERFVFGDPAGGA